MSDVLKRYWWVAALAGVFLAVNGGILNATPKIDPQDQAYATGLYSWCIATTPAKAVSVPSTPTTGTCPNCNGRGKVGDGVVMLTCAMCGGTGKLGTQPISVDDDDDSGDEPQETPQDAPQQAQDYADCSDASCSSGSVRTRRGVFGGFFRRR